jgi:hypothetical protein
MRKIALIVIGLMLFAGNAMAAMTWAVSVTVVSKTNRDGSILYTTTITGVSDGNNPDEFNISDYMATGSEAYTLLKDSIIYDIITDPGVQPDGVWDVSIDDGDGEDIITLTGLSVTATQHHPGNTDKDQYPLINNPDLQIDFADIGSNLDSATIIIKSYGSKR